MPECTIKPAANAAAVTAMAIRTITSSMTSPPVGRDSASEPYVSTLRNPGPELLTQIMSDRPL